MGNVNVQKCGSKHSDLFAGTNASDVKFIFSEKKRVVEAFKANQTVDGDDGDERNIHKINFEGKNTNSFCILCKCCINIVRNAYICKNTFRMQLLIFIILYPILWLISMLPFRVLYFFSDCTYILIYRIIGYRKKTVRENLLIALPHLSQEERRLIEKKFFHHFVDGFFEMIKTMNISDKELYARFKFTNLEVYQNMEKQGKSIAILCAHYSSYEWLVSMNKHISFKGFGIYKKLKNKYFDKLIRDIRSRFDADLIDTKETINVIVSNERKGIKGVYGFAMDQSPKASKAFHWAEFFGIKVPVHTGGEMIAKRMNMNVIFVKGKKIKRGYYEATFVEMVDNPKEVPNYEITDMFLRMVEAQILEAPEYYLWTHKRWKYAEKSEEKTEIPM